MTIDCAKISKELETNSLADSYKEAANSLSNDFFKRLACFAEAPDSTSNFQLNWLAKLLTDNTNNKKETENE